MEMKLIRSCFSCPPEEIADGEGCDEVDEKQHGKSGEGALKSITLKEFKRSA